MRSGYRPARCQKLWTCRYQITLILRRQRGVTADTALRLARYFGTTPELWLNLQKTWELRRAEVERATGSSSE